ncbi:endonuclease/exonuclease/phosphatase family protein [Neokomagataea tanensis]|uniref:Endonuclease/exonuclease/phosphatase family protein n=1 Tax=Neokomagataea tanensis TaxID=661191 RepID=A0A4Y6V1U0_9PROT|nr:MULTISPECIES: endonuclease/exonuclease/phosphatase family protein [Neokomagataea]QDH23973.1 endonuclease/exonuclease/phosphatase family protein [Neokomagataea tanensis]
MSIPANPLLTGDVIKIISWNLLHTNGATLTDVLTLIRSEDPDIVTFQEARPELDMIQDELGGEYHRTPLPGRTHGTAYWSRLPSHQKPTLCQLPRGVIVKRNAQIIDFKNFSVANVHLSHGQLLNRRQLKTTADSLPKHALIIGDFNIVGPVFLPGFQDIGPRERTHHMLNRLPLRLDRCLAKGFSRMEAKALPRFGSDHRPICLTLRLHSS